jgi:hypothetical protein
MSGTLDHLGLHVPGPYLGANKSNPKGFFESRWSVQFHKRITSGAGINDFDSRPDAFALAQAAVTDELRTELREFLARESREHDQVVVKDPRSVWAQRVWREAAERAGLEITYISMLRHPAEVVGSRTTYYATPADEAARHSYETFNVARWVNSSLVSERETRGQRRAFVSYVDLLHDWRPVLVGLAQDLGLSYDVDVAGGESSSVDEFIDPGLRRHQVTWDDLGVPEDLRSIAEGRVGRPPGAAGRPRRGCRGIRRPRPPGGALPRALHDGRRHRTRQRRDRKASAARAHAEAAQGQAAGRATARHPARREGGADVGR